MRPLSGERTERSIARRRLFLESGPRPCERGGRRTVCCWCGQLSVWRTGGAGGRPVGDRVGAGARGRRVAGLVRLGWRLLSDLPFCGRRCWSRSRWHSGDAGLTGVGRAGGRVRARARPVSRCVSRRGLAIVQRAVRHRWQPAGVPAVRLALAAAVIIAMAANTAEPVRRFGTWMIALGAAGTLAAGLASPFGTLAALLVGLAAAACARLASAPPPGSPASMRSATAWPRWAYRYRICTPSPASGQASSRWSAIDDSQREVLVRVYGRDAYDNQLLARLWRAALYRELAVRSGRAVPGC